MDNIFLVSEQATIPETPQSSPSLDAVHGQMVMCRDLPNNQHNRWISRGQGLNLQHLFLPTQGVVKLLIHPATPASAGGW